MKTGPGTGTGTTGVRGWHFPDLPIIGNNLVLRYGSWLVSTDHSCTVRATLGGGEHTIGPATLLVEQPESLFLQYSYILAPTAKSPFKIVSVDWCAIKYIEMWINY